MFLSRSKLVPVRGENEFKAHQSPDHFYMGAPPPQPPGMIVAETFLVSEEHGLAIPSSSCLQPCLSHCEVRKYFTQDSSPCTFSLVVGAYSVLNTNACPLAWGK